VEKIGGARRVKARLAEKGEKGEKGEK